MFDFECDVLSIVNAGVSESAGKRWSMKGDGESAGVGGSLHESIEEIELHEGMRGIGDLDCGPARTGRSPGMVQVGYFLEAASYGRCLMRDRNGPERPNEVEVWDDTKLGGGAGKG